MLGLGTFIIFKVFIYMGQKIEISDELKNKIILDSKNMSLRNISKKYDLNKNVVIRLLNKTDVIIHNNIKYIICKKTNKIFYDIQNKSGCLTKHIQQQYNLKYIKNDIEKYFILNYENENYVTFEKFIKNLRITFNYNKLISGIHKYQFKTKDRYVFFIENKKIYNNKKIKPIFLFKLKDRYKNSIFIYEDEWVEKKNLIESKLLNLLNLNKVNKIFARNCIVKNIDEPAKKSFLNRYHIQGNCNSSINLGCFYKNELIAVMTFTTFRNMTTDKIPFDYELNRFTTNINYRCIGVASKIFKFFLKSIEINKTIISYADRRWVLTHKNNLYVKLNFKLNQISKHDYQFIKKDEIKRIHKITIQQKYKYKKINDDEYLDYFKIWDCGKYRYIYKT